MPISCTAMPIAEGPAPKVVLSWGLGEDSTAIILRWLEDPTSRDFDLDELVIVVAMTGNEWEASRAVLEQHVLPRIADAQVRLIQVARSQRHTTIAGDGVVILDDSRTPTRLYLEGNYSLWDEMTSAGTIPQSGGARLCSVHSKGDALDPVISRVTRGNPYRHVIGFEAGETSRAAKDALHNTSLRTGEYPLIEWGWDRAAAVAYTQSVIGTSPGKSACTFCPYSLQNRVSRAAVLSRYAAEPAVGAHALLMEHLALALNPTQGLVGGRRLIDVVRAHGELDVVLDALDADLDEREHALYEVRRILRPRKTDPTKLGNAARSVRIRCRGSRSAMEGMLRRLADEGVRRGLIEAETGEDGILRIYQYRRGPVFPTVERFFVVAPALAHEKEHERFDQWWADARRGGRRAVAA